MPSWLGNFGLGGSKSIIGSAISDDIGRSTLDMLFKSVTETSGAILNPFVNFLVKKLSDANKIMDFTDGSIKSGGTKAVNEVLRILGNSLSVTKIPMVDGVFTDREEAKKTYLSYELALNLSSGLDLIKGALETIPNELGHYKNKSLQFVGYFSKIVEQYLKLFSVFVKDRRFIFFTISPPSYDKLLSIRKEMQMCLKKMQACLADYIKNGYTYKNISEGLRNLELGLSEIKNSDAIGKVYALEIFWESCAFMARYVDDLKNLEVPKEKTIFDAIDSEPIFDENIGVPLKNALRLTVNADRKTWNWEFIKSVGNKRKFEDWIKDGRGYDAVDRSIMNNFGFKQCKSKAEMVLKGYSGNSIETGKISVSSPLLGDYAEELKDCVDYTLANVREVINLGAKGKVLQEKAGNTSVKLSDKSDKRVNFKLKELLGENYERDKTIIEKREARLSARVQEENIEKVTDWYKKCEKSWNRIQGDYLKECGKVIMPSSSAESGKKEYDLSEHWNEINNYYEVIQENHKNKDFLLKNDYVLLVQRKSQKFLQAIDQWNKNRKQKEKQDKQREKEDKILARPLVQKADKHYKELMKKYEVKWRQSAEEKSENKKRQEEIKKAYKKIPGSVSTFVKDWTKNFNNINRFLEDKYSEME